MCVQFVCAGDLNENADVEGRHKFTKVKYHLLFEFSHNLLRETDTFPFGDRIITESTPTSFGGRQLRQPAATAGIPKLVCALPLQHSRGLFC